MDERPLEAMQEAIKVIKQADPEFKITLAGNYHKEIQGDLYYLSIPYGHKFPEDVKAERDRKGQISTVYTCCSEAFPNTFTFLQPGRSPLDDPARRCRWLRLLPALGSQQLDKRSVARLLFPHLGSRRYIQYLSGSPQQYPFRTSGRRPPGR